MTVVMTGFPGFLGSALLPRILARTGGSAICVVQASFAGLAQQRANDLASAEPALSGRIRLVEGDIARPGIGLEDPDAVVGEASEVWHLAAVYDLAVPRDLGMRVNVEGTRHMLDFAARVPGLQRFHYFSTCMVSGRYAGPFAEDDLDTGAPFNNFYEETKHLAEVEVRRRMRQGLPATIYRPAIVVGDSTTGETQKYDGPYFIVQWLLRQRRVALLPIIGDPRVTRVNLVPRDFVIEAVAYLSGLARSQGVTYQLADDGALTVDELVEVLALATDRRILRVPLPRRLAKGAIDHVPGVYRLLRIPSTAVDYFAHPTYYLTEHTTADLAGSGIEVPAFTSYADRLIAFMRAHPDIGSAAMA